MTGNRPALAPLLGLVLLLPASSAGSRDYRARHAGWACVDAAALGTHSAARRVAGGCYRVGTRQVWERLPSPEPNLMLMRLKPPRPGQPPLYFHAASVLPVAPAASRKPQRPLEATGSRTASLDAVAPPPLAASSLVLPPAATFLPPPAPPLPLAPEPPAAVADAGMTPASQAAAGAGAAAPAPAPVAAPAATAPSSNPPPSIAPPDSRADISAAGAGNTVAGPAASPPKPAEVALAEPQHRGLFWPILAWTLILGLLLLAWRGVAARRRAAAKALPSIVPALPSGGDAAGFWPAEEARSGAWRDMPPEVPTPGRLATQGVEEPPQAAELAAYKTRCVASLRHAGWEARTRFSAGLPGPDVVARYQGRVLSLHCHGSSAPVSVEEVEGACRIRERRHSDLAAIVSNGNVTEAARDLATRTGILLLREEELAALAA